MPKKALLLMNMGGATTKEELRMFLLNMFRDPNILTIRSNFFRSLLAKLIVKKRLDASWANYEGISGSPLPRITNELVSKLEERLGDEYLILPVMCYTKPGNDEAIMKLIEADITEVVLFPLYPHYSTTTVKSSVESFLQALKNERNKYANDSIGFSMKIIEPFYTDKNYNETIIDIISAQMMSKKSDEYTLLFSAHGLPEKIVKKGDPYQKQVEEHVEILGKMLEEKGINFKQIKLAYQSRVGPMKWIRPSLEETLSELRGEKVLIYPISFTIDNSETIYELHREYAKHAKGFGISVYEVCDCPNTHNRFVESIINKIDPQ